MQEWIGSAIANWPVWAVIIVLALISLGWIFYFFTSSVTNFPWSKKEHWQDRYRRIERETKEYKAKMKAKRG